MQEAVKLPSGTVALVAKILQIILRDLGLIYLLKKFFFLVDRLSARGWLAVEYSPAVIYDILRLCTEYFTKGTVYCKIKRSDL